MDPCRVLLGVELKWTENEESLTRAMHVHSQRQMKSITVPFESREVGSDNNIGLLIRLIWLKANEPANY